MARIVGAAATRELERLTRAVYARGRAIAEPRGIIIADTKFEFGVRDGRIIIVDEVLTPDSSRFWPATEYAPGRSQPSFDKQPLRDYLDGERRAAGGRATIRRRRCRRPSWTRRARAIATRSGASPGATWTSTDLS